MKTKTRHQLKGNELAHAVSGAIDYMAPRSHQIVRWGAVALVLALLVVAGLAYRQRTSARGDALLADALVALNARVVPPSTTDSAEGGLPAAASVSAIGSFSTEGEKLTAALPKLQAAADAFPDSSSGITARYHLAGALASLGRLPEAQQAFEDVARRAGTSALYGRMAQLGQADVQAKSGKIDDAIATLKRLAESTDTELPVDAVLMELARAYTTKGSFDEARKTYTQIVDQYPDSPYVADARTAAESIKGS
jgi:tetratricopeptide (TPR) repeat protein